MFRIFVTLISSFNLLFMMYTYLMSSLSENFQLWPDNLKLNYNKLVKNAVFATIHYQT